MLEVIVYFQCWVVCSMCMVPVYWCTVQVSSHVDCCLAFCVILMDYSCWCETCVIILWHAWTFSVSEFLFWNSILMLILNVLDVIFFTYCFGAHDCMRMNGFVAYGRASYLYGLVYAVCSQWILTWWRRAIGVLGVTFTINHGWPFDLLTGRSWMPVLCRPDSVVDFGTLSSTTNEGALGVGVFVYHGRCCLSLLFKLSMQLCLGSLNMVSSVTGYESAHLAHVCASLCHWWLLVSCALLLKYFLLVMALTGLQFWGAHSFLSGDI